MKQKEHWKSIPGFPGYKASSEGRIKRLDSNKILEVSKRGTVYAGRKSAISVAFLILITFIGPPPLPYGCKKGCSLARHLDDNRSNNKPKNLAWGTHKDNTDDAIRNGRINTPEHIAKTRAAHIGMIMSNESRLKMSLARKNRITKSETRIKMSITRKAMWKDPEFIRFMYKRNGWSKKHLIAKLSNLT